ncbi:hypothetical protein BDW02DRAFT_355557 [Decorospora gaudefroyi]|uniref:Uncharacterized protein n=1 Tax=Decorospora gaudefroyi TaxID=184978 RepID=A0A6A5KKK3_9PLEO|nr:hypothetical protein BDW02DRAFT_355557 [Decorospora gaudefroyi]
MVRRCVGAGDGCGAPLDSLGTSHCATVCCIAWYRLQLRQTTPAGSTAQAISTSSCESLYLSSLVPPFRADRRSIPAAFPSLLRTSSIFGSCSKVAMVERYFIHSRFLYRRKESLEDATCGQANMAPVLYDHRSDISSWSAAKYGRVPLEIQRHMAISQRLLLAHNTNITRAILDAAKGGYGDIVELFLQNAGDAQENGSR